MNVVCCCHLGGDLTSHDAGSPGPAYRFGLSLPPAPGLLQRRILDVVLGGVGVRELIDDVHTLAVRVVDPDEGLPLVRQSVLREDRLDRALGLARAAIDAF